ncbi:hypothetical protein BG261_02770 [Floricoccus tropicus]|uniref:Uncharacterized protein n=2 Tax=Floricoccus tropicus TaxID=1859473 RepID=A0A1E8GMN8_9LACT|nr:hypothetical protein BG261_02770 [Floricoccus tropicus]
MAMKIIGPQWNRQNLDQINENFKLFEGIPDDMKKMSVSVENSIKEIKDSVNSRFVGLNNVDLNEYKTGGLFFVAGGTNYPPAKASGMLQVVSSNSGVYVHQEFLDLNNPAQKYVRAFKVDQWSDWIELTVTAEELEKIKETIKNNTEDFAINLFSNGWFNNNLAFWSNNAGTVTIAKDTDGFNNLTMDSQTSAQVNQKVKLKASHAYFVTFDVAVSRYVKGLCGVQFNGAFKSGNQNIGLTRVSDKNDFENISEILVTSDTFAGDSIVYVGSISSANLTGKIRKLSIYDLTDIYGKGNEPKTVKEVDFKNLEASEKGIELTLAKTYAALSSQISKMSKESSTPPVVLPDDSGQKIQASDDECSAVFVSEMNKKAAYLGMSKTTFKNSTGLAISGQVSCSRDFLLLTMHALAYSDLLKYWGRKQYTVNVKGPKARSVVIDATVHHDGLEAEYDILGGKSGTLGTLFNATTLIQAKDTKDIFACVVMGTDVDAGSPERYAQVKAVADIAKQKLKNASYTPTSVPKVQAASIMKIPVQNPTYFTNVPSESLYSINENDSIMPASMTKVMTAILMLENVSNLNESIVLKASDIKSGSGPVMYEGDVINYLDAIHLMMLPSSNTAANTMSRVVGQKIINARGYI